jgi:predicted dehydrogenase
MSLSYALIGCGRVAPNHIEAALKNGLQIVAICDLKPEAMQEIVARFDLPTDVRQYTDYQKMLAAECPKLVAIATESGKHASIALDCIEAEANLIIEKPLALSLADADAIIKKAKTKGVKICACHQNRFNKAVQKIRQALEDGRFGKLFHGTAQVRWYRDQAYYKQASWRGTLEQDGGALMNQCIHAIDLLRWMMGDEITAVIGITDNLNHAYLETEDLGIAIIKFANGSYGIIEGTTNVFPADLEASLSIFGETGSVKAGGIAINKIETWQFTDGLDQSEQVKATFCEQAANVYGLGHNSLYADVISAISSDRQPYISPEDGRRALELVLAIYKSAAEGRPIKLPLDSCSTLDFKPTGG